MRRRRKHKPRPTGWRRVRRWVVRSTGVLVLLLVCLLGALALLLSNLDRPVVSDPLADYLREWLGIELTYDTLYATRMSELVGRDVRISSPAPVRDQAPELLRIGRIHATWAPGTLLSDHIAVHRVAVHDFAVTLVVDEDGRTTLDYLFPSAENETPTPSPVGQEPFALSRALSLLPTALSVDRLTVDGVTLSLVERRPGGGRRTTRLQGLRFQARLTQEGDHPAGTLHLWSDPDRGLTLTVQETDSRGRSVEKSWQGGLDLRLDLGERTLAIAFSALLTDQNLVDLPLPSGELCQADGRLTFMPDTGITRLDLSRFDLLDGAVHLAGAAETRDREDGTLDMLVHDGRVSFDLDRLEPWLPAPDALTLTGGNLELQVTELALDPETFLPRTGRLRLSGASRRLEWLQPGASARAGPVSLQATMAVKGPLRQDLHMSLTAEEMAVSLGADGLVSPRVELSVTASDTRFDLDDPLAFAGNVHAEFATEGAEATWQGARITEGDLGVALDAPFTGRQSYQADVRVAVDRMVLVEPSVGRQDLSGTTVTARVRGLRVDPAAPADARGQVSLSLDFGPLSVDADVDHTPRETHWEVAVDADTLAPLAPFLNPLLEPGEKVAWHRVGLHVASAGKAQGIVGGATPFVDQQGEVDVQNLNYRSQEDTVLVPRLRGNFSYRGGFDAGGLDLHLWADRWRYDELWTDRSSELVMHLSLSLPADRYRIRVDNYQGNLNYLDEGLKVTLDGVSGTANMVYERGMVNGTADLETERIDYADGPDRVWLDHVVHHLRLASREDITRGVLEVGYQARARRLGQNYSTLYPAADFSADLSLRLASLSAFSLDRCLLTSEQAGTRLELAMAMDDEAGNLAALARDPVSAGQALLATAPMTAGESLTLSGVLHQDLACLDGDPSTLSATGELVVPFRVESPEQVQYRLTGTLEFRDVSLELPGEAVAVQGLNGKCLIVEELRDGPDGFVLVPRARSNVYARAAFSDTQPYLSGDSYFSIERLAWSNRLEAGPLAGNFRVDRNMIRLDQLQMTVAGGTVSGQLLVDGRERATTLFFRGAANGLRLAGDSAERLDANMALAFNLENLDLNGRAHIVHIGRKTLLALLDLVDPYHEDVDLNEVRLALKAGYPRFVRVSFEHGFMTLKIQLGGVAGTVHIDEIRGIPVAPLLNTYLGDLL